MRWTHHPAWYQAETGRDPRAAYERENAGRLNAKERSTTGTANKMIVLIDFAPAGATFTRSTSGYETHKN